MNDKRKPDLFATVGSFVLVGGALLASPLAVLWSMNILFDLGIPYSLKSWAATSVFLLGVALLRRGKA